jgi:hypothetical protein
MLFTGIIFLACNVTLDTTSDILNLDTCTPTYVEGQSLTSIIQEPTPSPTATLDSNCGHPIVETPFIEVPIVETPLVETPIVSQESVASRYAPTIIAGSGLGLLALAGIGAFIANRKKKELEPEAKQDSEDIEYNKSEVEIPENILSSSQKFQRTYTSI